MQNGNLFIDYNLGRVFVDGNAVWLTMTEYRLLLLMANSIGTPIAREAMLEEMNMEKNNLFNLIHRVRHKIGKDFIKIQRGEGTYLMPYMQAPPTE